MNYDKNKLPLRLKEIVEDFEFCEGREKLELLLQYAEDFPPLPDHLKSNREAMEQVHECMTPFYISAESENGSLVFYFDVPESSPTVRGYASILSHGLEGATAEEVLDIPAEFYAQMGLENLLTFQRLNGFGAILAHIKRLALIELSKEKELDTH